jgi:hypothetical protein
MHNCKFNDCLHINEKGCAITEALEAGEIAPTRYISYLTFYEELKGNKKYYDSPPRGSAPSKGLGDDNESNNPKSKKSNRFNRGKNPFLYSTWIINPLRIEESDTQEDITWLSKKIAQLRIFSDENDLMNLSVIDVKGEILVVSQFTLFASTKKGNRPSFIRSAKPDIAIPLYESLFHPSKINSRSNSNRSIWRRHANRIN